MALESGTSAPVRRKTLDVCLRKESGRRQVKAFDVDVDE